VKNKGATYLECVLEVIVQVRLRREVLEDVDGRLGHGPLHRRVLLGLVLTRVNVLLTVLHFFLLSFII
jgi:hypothetical protein